MFFIIAPAMPSEALADGGASMTQSRISDCIDGVITPSSASSSNTASVSVRDSGCAIACCIAAMPALICAS